MTLRPTDFERLLQANRILSSKLNLDEVLKTVLELATQVVRAEVSSLLLLDEKRQELYFDVALGSAQETVKQIRLRVGEGIAGWVAQKRVPLIVNDVSKDKRFTQKVDKSTKFQTKSILAVPLLVKDKLIGVIEAINKEKKGKFSKQDLEIFQAFASQAAIAIENARLFSEITREKEKLNTVFAEMSDGVLFLDEDQRIVILNGTAARFLNLKSTAAVGEKLNSDLLKDFELSPALDHADRFPQDLVPFELLRREGKDLYLSGLLRKLHPTKELPQGGSIVLLRDITESRREERLKRNFLSLMSHKLKTPLTVILGYGPALASSKDTLAPFQAKAVEAICHQGQVLNELVDKLLRFTLVESDTLNRKMEMNSVPNLLAKAIQEVENLKSDKKVEIKIDPSVADLPTIESDSNLTVDVFKNVLENGMKFNDKDQKWILVKGEKKGGTVMISFQDNGVGIPSEEKEKVFIKFYQIENSFTGQVPGAGLGLALCKRVMEEMGGAVLLDSSLGKGTTISLRFPQK